MVSPSICLNIDGIICLLKLLSSDNTTSTLEGYIHV